jgi:hypothetical protein
VRQGGFPVQPCGAIWTKVPGPIRAPNDAAGGALWSVSGNSLWGAIVTTLILRFRGPLIAFMALALSAGLAFGAQPTTTGLTNAAAHAGKTVPVQAQDEETAGDEDTDGADETTNEAAAPEDSADAADNCATDPSALTPEELAAMRHGSIVCWAAHQTDWPEWFSNHGAFVKCWAHQGKADATSCTEDPTAGEPAPAAPTAHGAAAGHGQGKGKGHSK